MDLKGGEESWTVIFTTLKKKKGKDLSQSDKDCRKQSSFIGTTTTKIYK